MKSVSPGGPELALPESRQAFVIEPQTCQDVPPKDQSMGQKNMEDADSSKLLDFTVCQIVFDVNTILLESEI